jgi:hypothetical protein
MSYQQLCGALGMLKSDGAALDWKKLDSDLRAMARLPEYEMNAAASPVLRTYRTMAIQRRLIGRGQLFDLHDCVPLI